MEVITDFGGRVESLYLRSRETGVIRNVLLGHHGDVDAIKENKLWRGMFLLPFASRIAYVSKRKFYSCLICKIFMQSMHSFILINPQNRVNTHSSMTLTHSLLMMFHLIKMRYTVSCLGKF